MLRPKFLDALLSSDRLARSLAGPRVGPRPLAAYRQPLAVPQAAIAADVPQPCDVLLHLTAKLTFDGVIVVEQCGQLGQFILGQVSRPFVPINPRALAKHAREVGADSIDV